MLHTIAIRRGRAGVVLGALLWSLLVLSTPSSSQPSDTIAVIKQDALPSNVDIAVALSEVTPLPAVDTVLVGRDDDFADALASGVLQSRSPLLLVPSGGPVPSNVRDEITRLGPSRALILGGTAAVTAAVEEELRGMGLTVERRAGGSRFDTAIAIARADAEAADTVILARAFPASGATDPTQGFADSIAAGGMSAEFGWPVLLTQTSTLTETTRAYLVEAGVRQVEIMGGTSAISAEVEQEIQAMGITTERLAGPSRAETAIAVAEKLGAPTASAAEHVVVVQGQTADAWAGGFAAAAHAALMDAPIVLATGDRLPPATMDWLRGGATPPTFAVDPSDGGPVLTCVILPGLCEEARVTLGLPPAAPISLLSADARGTSVGGYEPAVSADGRTVAFLSDGPVLSATVGDPHVYVRTPSGVEMVDVRPDGSPGATTDPNVHLSGDGRMVAFTSEDQTLSGAEIQSQRSAYVRDLATGRTRHVSVDVNGDPGVLVYGVSLDNDGSIVSYVTQGETVPGGCACYLMWWHDLVSDAVGFVHTPDGFPVGVASISRRPMLSGDGTMLAFMSAEQLLPEDGNQGADAYVFNITEGTLELVSVGPGGRAGGAQDSNATREIGISGDGRFVAFGYSAGDLIAGDIAEPGQVYLRDRTAGTTTRLTGSSTASATVYGASPQVSDNGSWVAFTSVVDLVGGGREGCGVYRWSTAAGTLERVDVGPGTTNECPFRVDVADDGSVVFDHLATLHSGDDSHRNAFGGRDVYQTGTG